MLNLIRKIRSISPDYILTYFAKSIIYGILSARIAGVKNKYAIIGGLGYAFTKISSFLGKETFLIYYFKFI